MFNAPTEGLSEEEFSSGSELHVVGIGASAGGLEALESFFHHMPEDSGMAFVVIQHLSPDFKSQMDHLIARKTQIPVHQVVDGIEVQPNAIYLLPAKMEMVISRGKLLLTERNSDRSFSHPIDQFFRSLAHDRGRYSVAVVLSGTGSDGSRGVREVHGAGGLVISQDEASAKFAGMPMSAQATGVVDLVLPPEAMSSALVRYTKDGIAREKLATDELVLAGIERVFQLLNQKFGIDFSQYKSSTVGRRMQRRLSLLHLSSLDEYVELLSERPSELNDLYRDLLICVTKFFRDPDAYATLANEIIPKIFARNASGQAIRAWVAGCSTGEEAYSIAMLLDEERRRRDANVEIKVFATDAHSASIHTAARGIYSAEALSEMSEQRRRQYFRHDSAGFQVTPELRQMIVFSTHNVINDAPFTQLDLVTCRNLLIYLQQTAQLRALSLFHFGLKRGGALFLGPSESPGDLSDEFQVINAHWRIYLKRRDIRFPLGTTMPRMPRSDKRRETLSTASGPRSSRVDQSLIGAYDELLSKKMGSSLLIDRSWQILHVFGGAEKYLRHASGRPSGYVLDTIHEKLKSALGAAIHHATRKNTVVVYRSLEFAIDGAPQKLRVSVEPIGDPVKGTGNALICFSVDTSDTTTETAAEGATGVADPSETRTIVKSADESDIKAERVTYLETELVHAQENLQATIEEMETANEELQAANEELVASNEELQSTNEELHSVNEELYTVNAEHQRRLAELAEANADMDNLLATTRVGVAFLDNEFRIRRYTPQIAQVLQIDSHSLGRPIVDFARRLRYDELIDSLHEVLESQEELEQKVYDHSGNPFLLRIVPYRTGAQVHGVVLTLVDIALLSAAESQLERFKFMTENASDFVLLANRDGRLLYVNPSMCKSLGSPREQLLSMSLMDVDGTDLLCYQAMFDRLSDGPVGKIEADWKCRDGRTMPVEISLSSVEIESERFLCASGRDVTERRAAELEMRVRQMAIEATQNGIVITNPNQADNPITYANSGFFQLTGYDSAEVIGRNCRFLQGEASDSETLDELREAIQAGKPFRGAVLNYRKDGTTFWNDLQIAPVFDSRKRLVNFVGVQNDISDRIRVQEALELAHLEAKAANQAKSAFMANMSHELRTPMTAVLGFADILSDELTEESHRDKVATIRRNGEYLLALLNDILDLSKIEAGKIEIRQQSLNTRKLIDEVQTLMELRAAEEGVPLTFDWHSQVPERFTADEVRVRQVLVNLIGNALKFTDEGEVRVEIGMDRDAEPPVLKIAVRDTGIGIHDSHLPELFTPFSQTGIGRRRRFGGTGLGLSISKRLAEGMGGAIAVESKLGEGSTFTLSLPLTVEEANEHATIDAAVKASTRDQLSLPLPRFEARILLADDRRDIWRIGKYYLEKCGAKVTVVEDGLQAVEETQRANMAGEPFDLILMDMQMPVMTGREAVAEIRGLGVEVPIIALTADAMEGERESCISMGCDDYFPKPIDGLKLMNLVAFHLAAR
jgi:two-component system, chemotaxis family, CheB/CheR fusion protein